MSKFRDFEVLYEKIPHLSKCLTLNQAISVLVVESFPFSKEEKFQVSLVVCKLEYLRGKRKYSEELGHEMYATICDIFSENTQYENFLLLSSVLDKELTRLRLTISTVDYNHIAPIIGKYFSFPPTQYKNDVLHACNLMPKKHAATYHQPVSSTPISRKRKIRLPRLKGS